MYNCPKVTHPPAQSSDLNSIGNLWEKLNMRIKRTEISSTNELKRCLQKAWERISTNDISKIVASMSSRLQNAIIQGGYLTK